MRPELWLDASENTEWFLLDRFDCGFCWIDTPRRFCLGCVWFDKLPKGVLSIVVWIAFYKNTAETNFSTKLNRPKQIFCANICRRFLFTLASCFDNWVRGVSWMFRFRLSILNFSLLNFTENFWQQKMACTAPIIFSVNTCKLQQKIKITLRFIF